MLISSRLPQNMWGEAILTSNYLLNKVSRKKEEKTPFELQKGRAPSYQILRVWRCLAKVVVPTTKKVKIGPKIVDYIFMGNAQNKKAYWFLVYDLKIPDIQINTIMESRNASFLKMYFLVDSKMSQVRQNRLLRLLIVRTINQKVNLRRPRLF